MKKFQTPLFFNSSLIQEIKKYRDSEDRNKKDFSPTKLNFGTIEFILPRFFGFCYGVENALEIIYKAIEENPNENIYLLSEIIHNPFVNSELNSRGVKFIFNSEGKQIIEWDKLTNQDIIVIPAFGVTVEVEKKITDLGLTRYIYNTTCPFVVKVWNKAEILGKQGYTILIHGKYRHEETQATFSHSKQYAPTLIVRDIEEVKVLSDFILLDELQNPSKQKEFFEFFKEKYSSDFKPDKHLEKIAVVNQTTMIANETKEISEHIKSIMIKKYGIENLYKHFADTRDTLCYATHHNQRAIYEALESEADFSVVVGGYNSSNTTHIVKLCKKKIPTYFILSENNIISKNKIRHYDIDKKIEIETDNYIPEKDKVKIILASGSSCPDSIIENVLKKLLSFFPKANIPDNYKHLLT